MLPGQHHLKFETMKHFFLWAVAISAFFSSCETADEYISNPNMNDVAYENQYRSLSNYEVYTNVVSGFTYDNKQSHYNNLLQFELHVNNSIPNGNIYEAINFTHLTVLENTDATYINQLNYSIDAKAMIVSILDGTFNTDSLTLITDTEEQNLITTLYAIHNDGNGDDEWKNNKTIAFAYGAQYNLTQAILYAGAINLLQ